LEAKAELEERVIGEQTARQVTLIITISTLIITISTLIITISTLINPLLTPSNAVDCRE